MTLVTTTFDPNNRGSAINLSNGYLTANVTSGTGSIFATRPCPGLTYFEIATQSGLSGTPRVGIRQFWQIPSFNTDYNSTNNNLGADIYSIGYDSGGSVYVNGSSIATLASWTPGNTICVAINTIYQLIWFNVNGGNWNNSGNANVVGHTGGININSSVLSGSSYFPAVGAAANASFNGNFTSNSWTYTAPSGFNAISNVTVVARQSGNTNIWAHTKTVANVTQRCTQVPYKSGTIAFTAGNAGSPLAANVSVSGTVQQVSTPIALMVRVYDQHTGELLESNVSTGGNFYALAHGRSNVFIVALDPTSYRAQIYDQVTPA
jgi:hypothetical protein